MTGKELHEQFLSIQASRGLEGTSWIEEGEMGGQDDWNELAKFIDEVVDEAVVEVLPGTEAGQRTD